MSSSSSFQQQQQQQQISIPEFLTRYYTALVASSSMCHGLPLDEEAFLVELLKCLNRKNKMFPGDSIDGKCTSLEIVIEWMYKSSNSGLKQGNRKPDEIYHSLFKKDIIDQFVHPKYGANVKFSVKFLGSVKDKNLLITPDVNRRCGEHLEGLNLPTANPYAFAEKKSSSSTTGDRVADAQRNHRSSRRHHDDESESSHDHQKHHRHRSGNSTDNNNSGSAPTGGLSVNEFLDLKYNELILSASWTRQLLQPLHIRMLIEFIKVIGRVRKLPPGASFAGLNRRRIDLFDDFDKLGFKKRDNDTHILFDFLVETRALNVTSDDRVELHDHFLRSVDRKLLIMPNLSDRVAFASGSSSSSSVVSTYPHHNQRQHSSRSRDKDFAADGATSNKHVRRRNAIANDYESRRNQETHDSRRSRGGDSKFFNDSDDEERGRDRGGRRRGRHSSSSSRERSRERTHDTSHHFNAQQHSHHHHQQQQREQLYDELIPQIQTQQGGTPPSSYFAPQNLQSTIAIAQIQQSVVVVGVGRKESILFPPPMFIDSRTGKWVVRPNAQKLFLAPPPFLVPFSS